MKHLYGIVETNSPPQFEGDVYTVGENGLTAVVRTTHITDYRDIPREELMQCLVEHQAVIEALLENNTVLPVQFGCLLADDEHVLNLLKSGKEQFHQILAELDGQVQMEVIVLWDNQKIMQEIAAELGVEKQKANLNGKSGEEARRVQAEFGRKLHLGLVEKQDALQALVRDHLAHVSHGIVKNPQMDEDMAVNLGVLINEDDEEQFDTAVHAIDEATDGRYQIKVVGPLPPHSFAKLNVRVPKPHLVEHARELLGLPEQTTLGDIKSAYRNHAHYTHPDKNSELDSIVKMTELAQSYKLLRDIGRSQPGDTCALDADTIGRTLIISVERPEDA